jgi:hypothetical protein
MCIEYLKNFLSLVEMALFASGTAPDLESPLVSPQMTRLT